MNKVNGIIIFGANGSGKTTLGRELANELGYKHMDIEDYYFLESKIPYSISRSKDECIELMLLDIQKCGSFVISAVAGNLGDEITSYYKLAVFLSTPKEIRMERIKQREIDKFGNRVLMGGDMYERQQKFHKFAATRSLTHIDEWAKTLTCPVIRLDGTLNLSDIVKHVVKEYKALHI